MVYFPWPALEHRFLGTTQFTENNKTTALRGRPPTSDLSQRSEKMSPSNTHIFPHAFIRKGEVSVSSTFDTCMSLFFVFVFFIKTNIILFSFHCSTKCETDVNHFSIYCVKILLIFHKDKQFCLRKFYQK